MKLLKVDLNHFPFYLQKYTKNLRIYCSHLKKVEKDILEKYDAANNGSFLE